MDWKPEEEDLIRRYLLCDAISDKERRVVETRLLEENYSLLAHIVEDELIDEYASGALTEAETKLFTKNFILTPDRQQNLIIALEILKCAREVPLQPEPAPPQPFPDWIRWFFKPAWKIAVFALLIVGLGLTLFPGLLSRQDDVNKGLGALNKVYATQRPLESRITGLGYAPFVKQLGGVPNKPDYAMLDRAERILRDAYAKRPDASSQHALGRLYLAKMEFDKAQKYFNFALQTEPNNASLHSDLGAALFEKWSREQSTIGHESEETKRQSLEQLSQALRLDSKLPEAHFNLALLYQSENQTQMARQEWRNYLDIDHDSTWAKEARENLSNLN